MGYRTVAYVYAGDASQLNPSRGMDLTARGSSI